ncbi:sensor histidine kinase [Flavobacterium caeni]|uniref:histidine kinase n=1 Tax=Flavobacterium caeni TaxID=490189 RepID=A0A1G5ANL4_9FLAO|nr:HAMP domain-containing sensor histidine kinase [Flavobacterium caeni]SCX79503.1 two-component system, OmpR family, phosphate regulon sensor histidine kinase PhoR [Flavobacterium caeni]
MKINKLNIAILLGLAAIIGILVVQLLWTREAFNLEEKKFSQKVHIALLEVAKKLYEGTNHELPAESPVQKVSNDYYIVNIDNDFEPEILEYYLRHEFDKINLQTDFEYAMYNCHSDEMVYGNYVPFDEKAKAKHTVYFPKHQNLVYYFAIRFPGETNYLFSSLRFWFILSFALMVVLIVYVYSIFTILQQRKYSELQRDFVNNMTHEFKTPLSSILLASNFLKKHPAIQADDKLEKYTDIIIDQSDKLNDHIGKILHTAKSDSAPLELERIDLRLVPVIEDIIDNIKVKHPTLLAKVKSSHEYVVSADPFHFSNLVYNLIDNSIKYCDTEPDITVRMTHQNKTLHLSFIDNGIGIPPGKVAYIFDRFTRIPSAKSNEVNGFGLGLYYVKKICTLHRWKISARNNPDRGITITILIPLQQ